MNAKDFQPNVLEFFAEAELIEIVPSFNGETLHLISVMRFKTIDNLIREILAHLSLVSL
jgi:hypothetical protein